MITTRFRDRQDLMVTVHKVTVGTRPMWLARVGDGPPRWAAADGYGLAMVLLELALALQVEVPSLMRRRPNPQQRRRLRALHG